MSDVVARKRSGNSAKRKGGGGGGGGGGGAGGGGRPKKRAKDDDEDMADGAADDRDDDDAADDNDADDLVYYGEGADEEQGDLYCVCRQPDDGRPMVQCDACDNWFHFTCVGLARPLGDDEEYRCPGCERNRKRPPRVARCLNSGCPELARDRSRFCSEDCGLAWAEQLVMDRVVPMRLHRALTDALQKEMGRLDEKKQKVDDAAAARQAEQQAAPPAAPAAAPVPADGAAPESDRPADQPGTQEADDASPDEPSPEELFKQLDELLATAAAKHSSNASVAEIIKSVEQLRGEETESAELLAGLRDKRRRFEQFVETRLVELRNETEQEDYVAPEDETTPYLDCKTCGQAVPSRQFARHVLMCAARIERQKQTVGPTPGFAPGIKTPLATHCDAYVKTGRRYCKKLAASCPFHNRMLRKTKEEDAICGFPFHILVDADGAPERVCKRPHKECVKHFGWDRIRLAELTHKINVNHDIGVFIQSERLGTLRRLRSVMSAIEQSGPGNETIPAAVPAQ